MPGESRSLRGGPGAGCGQGLTGLHHRRASDRCAFPAPGREAFGARAGHGQSSDEARIAQQNKKRMPKTGFGEPRERG